MIMKAEYRGLPYKISSEEKKYALEVIERIHECTEIKDMLEEKTDES